LARSDEVFDSSIVPGLAQRGLYFTSIDDLDATEKAQILAHLREGDFPVLTPLAVTRASVSLQSRISRSPGMLFEDPARDSGSAGEGTPAACFVPLNGGFLASWPSAVIAQNLPGFSRHGDRAPPRLPGHAQRRPRLDESEADDLLAAVETRAASIAASAAL